MRLGERLTAARRDAQIRGAEAFMAGELDDAHLLAEHRAACDEIKRLRERDAAAQTLIGVLRLVAQRAGDSAGGPDFSLYRKYRATFPPTPPELGGECGHDVCLDIGQGCRVNGSRP